MTPDPISAVTITIYNTKHTNSTKLHLPKIRNNKPKTIFQKCQNNFNRHQNSIIHILYILSILDILYILYIHVFGYSLVDSHATEEVA